MTDGWTDDLGILLIGHGTRDSQGLAEFHETVRRLAKQIPSAAVEPAFLELAVPTISTGFERLVARNRRRILAAPLLLFAAGHAKQDIPAAIREVADKHCGVQWQLAEPLGCHQALIELSALRFREALPAADHKSKRVRLIVVGRGSPDSEATAEMARYAKLLGQRLDVHDVQVSFLAMSEPRLSEVLAEAARSECDAIVVQPHLLFHGELLGAVQQLVQDWSARVASKQWLITRHLGMGFQVTLAVLDRCEQARAAFASP